MNRHATARNFVRIAWSYMGRPYIWGGDDPMGGFDCSGLVSECLQSVGVLRSRERLWADKLWLRFGDHKIDSPVLGCLVLYFASNSIANHVGIYWRDGLYITAEGGGSETDEIKDAIEQNAFVKVRPVTSRKEPVFLDIFGLRG